MTVRFVPPMAALLVSALPTGDEWIYEAKFDGYRALALKDGASVKILSRKGNDLTADYPAIEQGGVILQWAADVEAAKAMRAYIMSAPGQGILKQYGFAVPGS